MQVVENYCSWRSNPNYFKCDIPSCGRMFKNMQILRRHFDALHRGKRHKCNFPGCDKSFAYPQGLTCHKQTCHLAAVYK